MRLRSASSSTVTALHIKAGGQRYKHVAKLVYLGAIRANAKISTDIKRRISFTRARLRKYDSQLYDRSNAQLTLKVRLIKIGGAGSSLVRTCDIGVSF